MFLNAFIMIYMSSLTMFAFFLHINSWIVLYSDSFFCMEIWIFHYKSSWCNMILYATHISTLLAYQKWFLTHYIHQIILSITLWLHRIFRGGHVFASCIFKNSFLIFVSIWRSFRLLLNSLSISLCHVCFFLSLFLWEIFKCFHIREVYLPPFNNTGK